MLSVWQSSTEVFILLRNEAAGSDAEVEFTGENQMLRVKPARWNERILCVNAPGEQNKKKQRVCGQHNTKHNEICSPESWLCSFRICFIADFPAGNVKVTVYSNGVPLSKAQLQYYSHMEEVSCLLARAVDPVDFMCQVENLKGS